MSATDFQLTETHPPAPSGRRVRSPRLGLRAGIGLGFTTMYLSLIVLIPLAALTTKAFDNGISGFWDAISSPEAWAALKLTVLSGLGVSIVNAIFGTLIAWVLVRDKFPGKSILEAVIDLPFALPTIVAGLILLALYGVQSPIGVDLAFKVSGVVMALLFVTLPFVVRTVEPVLIELDQEMEEAAVSLGASRFTTFRRVVFPNLLPAIASGTALSFARAISEFGSTVLISGNLPFKTQVSAVFIYGQIESDRPEIAAAVSVVLLLLSLVVLLALSTGSSAGVGVVADAARVKSTAARLSLRWIAIFYVGIMLLFPIGLLFWRTFENGVQPVIDQLTTPSAAHAFRITFIVAFWTVIGNTIFGLVTAILLVRHSFPGKRVLNAFVDLPFAVAPVVVGLSLILVYGPNTSVGSWFADHGFDIVFALPGMVMATMFVSLPFVVRELVPVLEEIGDDQEQAAWTLGASRRQTFLRVTLPSIRWALAYGVVLTLARSLGEYGAILVVSGNVIDHTQTAPLYVGAQYQNFNTQGAYAVAFALAAIAIAAIVILNILRPKEHT